MNPMDHCIILIITRDGNQNNSNNYKIEGAYRPDENPTDDVRHAHVSVTIQDE